MSGPKSGELEIEVRRRAMISALRQNVVDAQTEARNDLLRLESQMIQTAGLLGRREDAEAAIAAIEEAISKIGAAASFEPGFDLHQAQEDADWIRRKLDEIVESAKESVKATKDILDAAAHRHGMLNEESGSGEIDSIEKEAAASLIASMSKASCAPEGENLQQGSQKRDSREEDIVEEVHSLVGDKFVLGEDRAFLLGALRRLDVSEDGLAGSPDKTVASQLVMLLPGIKARRAQAMRLLSKIESLRSALADSGCAISAAPAFNDLDQADRYASDLQKELDDLDGRKYIRSCIDEAMRSHGYDISRSVVLNDAGTGSHELYIQDSQHAASEEGIHVFLSNDGDVMLEVVGVEASFDAACPPDLGSDRPIAASMAKAPSSEISRLVSSQMQFCNVYSEIKEDLESMGVRLIPIFEAEPDEKHCKTISVCHESDSGFSEKRKRSDIEGLTAQERLRRSGGATHAREASSR